MFCFLWIGRNVMQGVENIQECVKKFRGRGMIRENSDLYTAREI